MEEIEQLANELAALLIWLIVMVFLYIFSHGMIFLVIKFVMTIMFVFGIRDWFIDYHLFSLNQKLYKEND